MKYKLTDYQEVAAAEVLRGLRKATRDFTEDREHHALSLAAPTGAGKTVIAAADAERLLHGDDEHPADAEATILWITDNPSLNEQTRRKMLMASDMLKPAQLVTLDAAFDQDVLDRGVVYFLNVQKLGKGTSFVTGGVDARKFSFWTTLANTISARGGHLYIVIDEAHRGTGTGMATRPTIVRRIISDPEGVLAPAPVVWGISATPERFQQAMATASTPSRARRDVVVNPEDVRESGLLKDKILIRNPNEAQPSDSTLTRVAVAEIQAMSDAWSSYSTKESEPPVQPALVVQVAANTNDATLASLLNTIFDAWPGLKARAVGHSFEAHTALTLGTHSVRYIAPQDIQDDPDLRVVLFKEALTTGWDCPRAEVMLSFRKAQDSTYIAQLIGRMVRTPLAKRITTDEVLNTVGLFLPHYDEAAVDAVIERLRSDPDAPPTAIERNAVTLKREASLDKHVLESLKAIPTYVVPARVHRSQVARLHTFAAHLAGDHIDDQALEKADKHLLDTVERERNRLAADGSLTRVIDGLAKIEVQIRSVSLTGGADEVTLGDVAPDADNINDLMKAAGRGLRDGLAKTYWGHLVDGGEDSDQAKLITAALASDGTVVAAVESAAQGLVATWLKAHSRALTELPEARKAAYHQVRAQARTAEPGDITLPDHIVESGDNPPWDKHVYVDEKGKFPAKFNGWESGVLNAELVPDRGLVAWYRNPTGGTRAVRVPYEDGGLVKPMYPDFVLLHRDDDGKIVPSIVDPHNHALADAGPKWRGLAAYAEKHGTHFRRIDAVIQDEGGKLLRLDLQDPTVRLALKDVHGKEDLVKVFRDQGGDYA